MEALKENIFMWLTYRSLKVRNHRNVERWSIYSMMIGLITVRVLFTCLTVSLMMTVLNRVNCSVSLAVFYAH
jgi:hypothetical protein